MEVGQLGPWAISVHYNIKNENFHFWNFNKQLYNLVVLCHRETLSTGSSLVSLLRKQLCKFTYISEKNHPPVFLLLIFQSISKFNVVPILVKTEALTM